MLDVATNYPRKSNENFPDFGYQPYMAQYKPRQQSCAGRVTVEGGDNEVNGQWLGRFRGSNSGDCVLNIDDMGSYYQGHAYLLPENKSMPITFALIRTPNKAKSLEMHISIAPIHPDTGDPTNWDRIGERYPGIIFPKSANIKWKLRGQQIKVEWITNINTFGSAQLAKSRTNEPSEYKPLLSVTNWRFFKSFVAKLEPRRFIFRGQKDPRRLRTHYHRTGRADLMRFRFDDLRNLHQRLSARTNHIFDLRIPDENGAFLNLVQHHGYPTPLLDWTYSPYVSAYFAYHNIKKEEAIKSSNDKKVRIFIFDQKQWHATYERVEKLTNPMLHISIMEFMAINNERMVPQQAVSSVTNVDDMESYIHSREILGKPYLQVIDLPVKERNVVMQELSTMGITAGSLFPGLDGDCAELRERFF